MTKKLTTDYGALEDAMQPHMRPLNRDAFNAVFIPREDRYASPVMISQPHWHTPPETKPAPRHKPDLTGLSFGRFKVIGYLGHVGSVKNRRSEWLVRCYCGMYECRRRRAINNPKNTSDACLECQHVTYLKREEYWRRTGRGKPTKNFADGSLKCYGKSSDVRLVEKLEETAPVEEEKAA